MSTRSSVVLIGIVVVVGILLQAPRVVDVVHAHRPLFLLSVAAFAVYAAFRGQATGYFRPGEFGVGRVVSRREDPRGFQLVFVVTLFIAALFVWWYFHPGFLA